MLIKKYKNTHILLMSFISLTTFCVSASNLKVNGEFNLPYSNVQNVPGWNYHGEHIGRKEFYQSNGYNWLSVYSHDLNKDLANWCNDGKAYKCRKSEISLRPGDLNNTQRNGWDGNWKIGLNGTKMWLAYGFKIRNIFDSNECFHTTLDEDSKVISTDYLPQRCYVYISQFHTRGGTPEEDAGVSPIQGIKLTNGSNGTYKITADTKVCIYNSNNKCIDNKQVDFLDGIQAVDGIEMHTQYTIKMEIDWHDSNGTVKAWIRGGNGALKNWTIFANKSGIQTNPGNNQKNFQMGMYWGGLNANYFPPHANNVMEIDFDNVWVTEKLSHLPNNWQ